jgi:carbamoyl-phosphate synthase small subunit
MNRRPQSLFRPEAKAGILLSDGMCFPGEVVGQPNESLKRGVLGELVFNTAMTGYQEILTDPSYLGQIVVMTYPHIGNYGVVEEDEESRGLFAAGLVVHEISHSFSNWRSKESLVSYLDRNKLPLLTGIDTRAITRHVRDKGAMNAYLLAELPEGKEREKKLDQLRAEPAFGERDLVHEVSCKEPYEWKPLGLESHSAWGEAMRVAKDEPLVVVMDFGVKRNMLRSLKIRGCRVKVVPARSTADEILALKPKGILLSNGPGDPERVERAPETVARLIGKVPIFGICMGHQILGRAIGAKTFKMKFGHHGANHPVKDVASGRVMISSQNHGYAIDPSTLPKGWQVTQLNLNDNSVEGMAWPEKRVFSLQYHPEACPGPRDSMGAFDQFMGAMGYA